MKIKYYLTYRALSIYFSCISPTSHWLSQDYPCFICQVSEQDKTSYLKLLDHGERELNVLSIYELVLQKTGTTTTIYGFLTWGDCQNL